jgi:hypothetical protein
MEDYLASQLKGHPYMVVQHTPVASDGREQPHCHVLFSERTMDSIERGPEQFFKRWNAKEPEKGGARKDQYWHERETPRRQREAWYDLTNVYLEKHGHARRDDARKKERDTGFVAFTRGSTEAVTKGRESARIEECAVAHARWEKRKKALGLEPKHMSRAEVVELLREVARTKGQAGPRKHPEEMQQTVQEMETIAARLRVEVRRADRNEREGRGPSFEVARKQEEVVRMVDAWLVPEDEQPRGRLQTRFLHSEKKREAS